MLGGSVKSIIHFFMLICEYKYESRAQQWVMFVLQKPVNWMQLDVNMKAIETEMHLNSHLVHRNNLTLIRKCVK